MNFFCIGDVEYKKDEHISHRAQVIQRKDTKGVETYVNLRTFSNNKPTENGICLMKEEFEKLVPFFQKLENTTIKNGRLVKFFKVDPTFYELLLIKPNQDYHVMILHEDELKALSEMKDKIFDFCKV
jgi:hypothetical protein